MAVLVPGIPLCNTHITITRPVLGQADPYDPDEYPTVTTELVSSGTRAVIDAPTGAPNLVAGQRIRYSARIVADPCDLQAGDSVTSDDGTLWSVQWAREVSALGFTYVEGQVQLTQGYAA